MATQLQFIIIIIIIIVIIITFQRSKSLTTSRRESEISQKVWFHETSVGAWLVEELYTSLKEKTELLNNNTTRTVRCTLFWVITQRTIVTPDRSFDP